MRGRLQTQLRASGAAQRQASVDGDGAGQSAGHGSEGGGGVSAASARVVVMSLEAWEQPLLTEVYSLASLCLLRPGKQQRAQKSRAVRDTSGKDLCPRYCAAMASANDGTLAGYRSVENILEDFLPKEQLDQVKRVLYGGALEQPPIPASVKQTASDSNFDIQHFAISAASEQTRPPRVVRVGLVQNSIQVPTDRYEGLKTTLSNAAADLTLTV
ncbi:hypothetical protein QJQ45_024239 [Haematococcus lacustris]|nr:hypothetical protein QJQ45_024239 [Haematococcus lacustris]